MNAEDEFARERNQRQIAATIVTNVESGKFAFSTVSVKSWKKRFDSALIFGERCALLQEAHLQMFEVKVPVKSGGVTIAAKIWNPFKKK